MFLIIGLCNSSANFLFETILFLIPLPTNLFRIDHVAKVSDCKVSDLENTAKVSLLKRL